MIAPKLRGPALSAQHWQNLTFLHWPVPASAVARFFPTGVRPDIFAAAPGSPAMTYVGLVPFQMRGAGPGRLPVPYFGQFCETNVRLYSIDGQGRHGIVFRTLEAERLATVLLARIALGLPYTWARMTAARRGAAVHYRSRRRWPDRRRRAGGTIVVRPLDPIQPTELESWLTCRWGLHTEVLGQTLWVPNEHASWPLHAAELMDLDCDLVAACGVQVNGAAMLRPLWSPGVYTTFGRPQVVGRV